MPTSSLIQAFLFWMLIIKYIICCFSVLQVFGVSPSQRSVSLWSHRLLCKTVGHVGSSAEPSTGLHWSEHTPAPGILGLWVTCGRVGVRNTTHTQSCLFLCLSVLSVSMPYGPVSPSVCLPSLSCLSILSVWPVSLSVMNTVDNKRETNVCLWRDF